MTMNQNNNLKSVTKFNPVEKLQPRTKKMPSALLVTLRGIKEVLVNETGVFKGHWMFFKSITWDNIFNRPEWHPEFFEFKNKKEEKEFKKVFKELVPIIIIYNSLKDNYNEFFADKVMVKMAIPISVPYQVPIFEQGSTIKKIDEIRQLVSDLMAESEAFEWSEEVSEDQQEYRICYTKCPFAMILRAYGLTVLAGNLCMGDHVVFDNLVPDVIFSRRHAIGVGDSFCDHTIRMRKSVEVEENDELKYGDAYKIPGGRELIQQWEDNYKMNGNKFKF